MASVQPRFRKGWRLSSGGTGTLDANASASSAPATARARSTWLRQTARRRFRMVNDVASSSQKFAEEIRQLRDEIRRLRSSLSAVNEQISVGASGVWQVAEASTAPGPQRASQ